MTVRNGKATAVLVALSSIAIVFGPGLGRTATLWTDGPVVAQPAAPVSPWVALARTLKPAVVNVSTTRVDGNQRRHTEKSLGSGFVINPDGFIVTNNHVVDGAKDIRVTLADGRELSATVLGRDPRTDLVLLKVDAKGLPVVPLGDSAELEVGESVMAIGNPYGLEQTVTTGIISAKGRVIGEGPYDDFIQTDASINPGNSGGPLINVRGQAIGINAAIVTQTGGSVGIGFAIPINLAKPVLTQLASSGHVVRGYLGVTVQPVTADLAKSFKLDAPHGALVSSVNADSPALTAGVMPGDVIVAYDGRAIARSDELPRMVAETPVGRAVPVTLVRDGGSVKVTITVGRLADATERPSATANAQPTLGLALQTLTPELAQRLHLRVHSGVIVRGVEEDSPAATAGLQPGDVIGEVDRQPVTNVDELERAIIDRVPGTPTLLLVHRDDGDLYITMES
jgi:serine protease Do